MKKLILAGSASLLMVAGTAQANWGLNVGPIYVAPNDSSSSLGVIEQVADLTPGSTTLTVNDDVQLGLTLDYKFTPNWAVQLIAATPFSHQIRVQGSAIDGLAVGNTKHLPPTLLGQYHFTQFGERWQPFIGLGLNYTTFFDESIDPALSDALNSLGVTGTDDSVSLSLSDSWGLAMQAGVNVQLTPQFGIHAMISRMDISTTGRVRVNGDTVQSVNVDIDPVVTMVGVRWQF